ncbi:hypothetical protein SAMN05421505_11990 [Sinosporangium album]|uniref:Uncharacterized protein n=1 Tax=Sinosporangium album TaxID=504805 RepID=A0A1G8E3D7_9ACTN|nr:hypothetical protein [Sinosporangium album]SDH64240.1 hypothetical protein SAMN05421505_11990 [Sinosporangium album]
MSTPDLAAEALRNALAEVGVFTLASDVHAQRGGFITIGVAPGMLVWCGTESYRWISATNTWRVHPIDDPDGAARLLADHIEADPVFDLRARFPDWTILRVSGTDRLCAAPAAAGLATAPAVSAASIDELAARLLKVEAEHRHDPPHPPLP